MLVWQARAMEKMGKHWSIPEGRHRLTDPSQVEGESREPASSTTLHKVRKTIHGRITHQRQIPIRVPLRSWYLTLWIRIYRYLIWIRGPTLQRSVGSGSYLTIKRL
jgi:hypothetical protein